MGIVLNPIRRESVAVLEELRIKDVSDTYPEYGLPALTLVDPTTLILIDEAAHLQMNSLGQMRLSNVHL